jgi:hypothetical protein
MDKNQEKFLKFRTDLIELLSKYRYKISGTGYDAGSMNIEDLKNQKIYILKDSYSDYEALDNDWKSISESYILDVFPEENTSFVDMSKNVGIFTNNTDKVKMIFSNLYEQNKNNVEKYREGIKSEHVDLILKDNTRYIWIKPNNGSRGHRCGKAYIDKNLTLTELQYYVYPICTYCTRKDIVVF